MPRLQVIIYMEMKPVSTNHVIQNQPIEILFDQINNMVDFRVVGNVPFTNRQIMIAAYNLVFNTGVFSNKCKE